MIQPITKTMIGKEDGAVEMEMVSAAWRQRVLMECSLMSSSPAFFLVVVEVILMELLMEAAAVEANDA